MRVKQIILHPVAWLACHAVFVSQINYRLSKNFYNFCIRIFLKITDVVYFPFLINVRARARAHTHTHTHEHKYDK
jgi:hypothetical protein